MSTRLLRLHEPAVLIIIPGDPRRHCVYRNSLPDDLEAPVRKASCPDDLDSMSLVVALRIFRMIAPCTCTRHLKLCPGEGLCLLSFGLFFPGGVVLQGFTLSLLLPVPFT